MPFRGPRKRPIWSRLRNRHPLASVLSASELEQVFQQERARVDRNHKVFSMIVFLPERGRHACEALVEVLKERMRVYDAIGQLDSRRIALLLPETDSRGAWTFAEDAVTRLGAEGLAYNTEVYSYPVDWADRNGLRTQRRPRSTSDGLGDAHSEDDSGNATGTSGPSLALVERKRTKVSLQSPGQGVVERPVNDLAPVLVQGISLPRRALDVLVTGTALLLLTPLFLCLALLIKLDSRGPIFYTQKRAGLGGAPFDFFKFRSMYVEAEARRNEVLADNQHKSGPIFKMKQDPRITRLGRILRRCSLDELPQLYNVLRGDMTLIGPRPPRVEEVSEYEPWQRRRLEIMGGLTCIWQVSGRSEIGFEEWVRMDIQYQEKRSLRFDLRLLWKTVGAVVSGRGAY